MTLKMLRLILKGLADDTRLKIINILVEKELIVKTICEILGKRQATISKHLARLRQLGLVIDRREGNKVYYSLNNSEDSGHKALINFLLQEFNGLETFIRDRDKLKKFKK